METRISCVFSADPRALRANCSTNESPWNENRLSHCDIRYEFTRIARAYSREDYGARPHPRVNNSASRTLPKRIKRVQTVERSCYFSYLYSRGESHPLTSLPLHNRPPLLFTKAAQSNYPASKLQRKSANALTADSYRKIIIGIIEMPKL